jgi:hypothetical protein
MNCLGIPADHRLRRLVSPVGTTARPGRSEHIRILNNFGETLGHLQQDGSFNSIRPSELDFGLELARPETAGGVVIILQHPAPSQTYQDGYSAEEKKCATLTAVKDLIIFATAGSMDMDSVTVLDSMPYINADFDPRDELHRESQEVFIQAMKAILPEVVVSCFSTETDIKFMELLRHWGIGVENDTKSLRIPGTNHEFLKVNAFHPSYAINYLPHESCFRRLLMLQFAKAFGRYGGNWTEEPFMKGLRKTARDLSKRYRKVGQDCVPDFTRRRFNEVLRSTTSAFSELQYFRVFSNMETREILGTSTLSELCWSLCDCGLFLREYIDGNKCLIDIQELRENLEIWFDGSLQCHDAPKSRQSEWIFVHQNMLVNRRSQLRPGLARDLEDLLFTLLRQLNLDSSRSLEPGSDGSRLGAYASAMLRFVSSIEKYVTMWSKKDPINPEAAVRPLELVQQAIQGEASNDPTAGTENLVARLESLQLSANSRPLASRGLIIGEGSHKMLVPMRIVQEAQSMP